MGYKKRQAIKQHRPFNVIQDPYYRKWKRLKKYIKDMVFVSSLSGSRNLMELLTGLDKQNF